MKRVFTKSQLVVKCTVTTVLFSLPFCAALSGNRRRNKEFLLACAGRALSAFLFSFQVHEKQILVPLMALVLVLKTHPRFCKDFGCVKFCKDGKDNEYTVIL